MMMRKALLGAALLTTVSSAAMAQATTGFYIGGAGGVNWLQDADVQGGAVNSEAEFKTGWGAVGALGYGLGNGVRLEFEAGYRNNDIDKTSSGNGTGDASALSFMGNVLYDIQTGTPFTPYVGVGVGYARTRLNDAAAFSNTRVDDKDWNFAYQGIVGVAYSIIPALKLTLDYRYFATLDPEYTTNTGVSVDSEYHSHAVMLGLRYEFGAPAPRMAQPAQTTPAPMPAPPPAAAPPPPPAPSAQLQRTFLVFFDFDKATITPEADRVIRQAAATAKQANVQLVIATGHADRAGSDKYNQALSERRARAVRDVLVSAGLSQSQIQVSGKGESQPLVPTPDGVREPQNRRVEIVLQ
jgi:outer membrane protein OmpA-like peptidoglycan-associated protein